MSIRATAGSSEEDRDGKVYRSLVDAAETFEKDPSAVLPRSLTRQREILVEEEAAERRLGRALRQPVRAGRPVAASERTPSADRALGPRSRLYRVVLTLTALSIMYGLRGP